MKLCRDLIPEFLAKKGIACTTRTLGEQEYRVELLAKLQEEVAELLEAETDVHWLEEMADVREVLDALLKDRGFQPEDLEKCRTQKAAERGRFDRRLYLIQS